MAYLIYIIGWLQLFVLVVSAMVPFKLKWKEIFKSLPHLHRQLYWVYGVYVVLAIVFNGLVCIFNADALADGSMLSRFICGYIGIFWTLRLVLQGILDVKEHLTNVFFRIGYKLLTMLFLSFATVFWFVVLS